MSDEFEWYREALKGNVGPITADHPKSGYFKLRKSKGGPWVPACIWTRPGDGTLVCRVGAEMHDPLAPWPTADSMTTLWTWLAKNPVAKDAAKVAFETGNWPGDAAPVASQEIGANNPPEAITDLIPMEVKAADEWLKKRGQIITEEDANIASNKVGNLRELKKKAEAAHKVEKAPHLEAGRLVDAKYKPAIDDADGAVKRLLAMVTVYNNAETARRQMEADELAAKQREEHAREVERLRKEAEAKAAAEGKDVDGLDALIAPLPPPPEPPKVAPVRTGGQTGKVISSRKVKVATVVDYDKALVALKDHPDMRALVQQLADRACKAGVPVAGVEFSEKQVAA